jgi:hypothetical protein
VSSTRGARSGAELAHERRDRDRAAGRGRQDLAGRDRRRAARRHIPAERGRPGRGPDYGPLADHVPDAHRSEKTIVDLLADFEGDQPVAMPRLRPYLSRTTSGLRVLAAPRRREDMRALTAADLDRALALLSNFDLCLLDCAAGVERGLAPWATSRADRLIIVATAEYVGARNVGRAISELPLKNAILAINKLRSTGDRNDPAAALERRVFSGLLERRFTVATTSSFTRCSTKPCSTSHGSGRRPVWISNGWPPRSPRGSSEGGQRASPNRRRRCGWVDRARTRRRARRPRARRRAARPHQRWSAPRSRDTSGAASPACWWEDEVQVEILATLGAWVAMFDYANWTDPEGKTRLILQLPSVRELVRGGAQQFDPDRDRDAFEQYLRDHLGGQQPGDVC